MGGDSNPRYLAVNTLSRRAQSTTLPPIHYLCRAVERGREYCGKSRVLQAGYVVA